MIDAVEAHRCRDEEYEGEHDPVRLVLGWLDVLGDLTKQACEQGALCLTRSAALGAPVDGSTRDLPPHYLASCQRWSVKGTYILETERLPSLVCPLIIAFVRSRTALVCVFEQGRRRR